MSAIKYLPRPKSVTYGTDPTEYLYSVDQYQHMIEQGILKDEDQVELLENHVVLKLPRNPPHDGTLDLVKAALFARTPPGWLLRVQQTVALADSQPEPDASVVRGNSRSYLTRHPVPADVGLVIEVADSSILRDQRDKTRIYARAGIPIYWIVNLVDRQVEVYSQPSGAIADPAYASMTAYASGESISLELESAAPVLVHVDDLLP